MFDLRLYRIALLPVVLALIVVAFSIEDRPRPVGTTLAPDAFDGARAARQLREMVARFPDRRPGSAADEALAGYVAGSLARRPLGGRAPFTVTVRRFDGQTIDGRRTLADVVATRAGAPGPGLLVVAHRDAAASGSAAALSGTAALLELARVFADGRLRRTMTLASTSGGSGGNAGAARLARSLPGTVAAVLVLGDVAGVGERRPMIVTTSDGRGLAPLQLERTVAEALQLEAGLDAGAPSTPAQVARLAFPFAPGEQGRLLKEGLPAVLLQVSGEPGPAADTPLRPGRLRDVGRAALRAIYALDNGPTLPREPRSDVVAVGKVVPGWAVRLLVGVLLLAPLLVAVDGCARVRRRGGRVLAWVGWALACALPFALTALAVVLAGRTGIFPARPPAPVPAGAVPVSAGPWVTAALAFLLSWVLVRPLALRVLGLRGTSPKGSGAGAATLLVLVLTGCAMWLVNPYAAGLLVLAAHLWIWVLDLGRRTPVAAGLALVALALVPLALVLRSVAAQIGDGITDFAWALLLGVAGGQPGILAWLAWSLVLGAAVATAILAVRGQPSRDESPDVTVRGPVGYAGPGSLGGTSSALRR